MFLIGKGVVAILLLAVTQSLASVRLEDMENKAEALSRMIEVCVGISWQDAHYWLLHSPETARVEEVRELIRGIESGKTWALEMLDILLKFEREIPGIDDQRMKMGLQDDHIIARDNSCPIVLFDDTFSMNSRSGGLSSSAGHSLSNNNIRDLGAGSSFYAQVELENFSTVESSTIILFSTICAFFIICTICDIVSRIKRSRNLFMTVNTLSKFSLYTNALAVLNTNVTDHDVMPALYGLRCLACCTVVIGHRNLISALAQRHEITLLEFLDVKNSWLGRCMLMTLHTVDTFFVMSGFFVSYWFLKTMKPGIKFNLPMVYLHRYLRITPCLATALLFAGALFHRLGSGPVWEAILNQSVNQCSENWWLYLLYVQNLVKKGYMCIPHAWYLAVDMQLFWLSTVVLYSLHRSPKYGLGLLSFFLIASVVTSAIILAINGYSNAALRLDMETSKQVESFENYYIPTYNRACPYLIGILLGYDVAKNTRRLTQANVTINWLVAGTLIALCTWFTLFVSNSNFAYDSTMEIAFTILVRPSWSIAMAWIVYAYAQGYGGLATRFLSMPLFIPLSQLVYCMYLVHPGIQAFTMNFYQNPAKYSGFERIFVVGGDLAASVIVAFVFSLFIESPVIVLEKILTNHGSQPERATVVQNPQKSYQEVAIKRQ